MAADEPPYLTVGTDVSAKYKGAFCEAKIKKVNRIVKCKVTFKNNLGSAMIPDDQIKGILKIGADVEAKHPEKNQFHEAVINKMQDYSQYTVVFDDGDETTLRRTSLCLKSGRHFAESPTLDQFPLTNPEHFGTPVIGAGKSKRKRRSTMNSASLDYESSDEDFHAKKKVVKSKERDPDLGKVVCVEYGDRRKKDSWYPGLIVSRPVKDNMKILKDAYLVRSFKDGKYYQVPQSDTHEFTKEVVQKVDNNTLRAAVEKAMLYYEKEELPPHWDKALFIGLDLPSGEESQITDTDSSDDEPSEEKDRFVAQLYKFMDERGTPINKAPTIGTRDLNLYKLFKIMHKMGGYNKVTNQNNWKMVYLKMGLPASNSAGSNQIKMAYKRYLHSFEDFYRKLGCTMVTNTRSTRGRHRSDRNIMITRNKDKDSNTSKAKNLKETKDKVPNEKKDDKSKNIEKKEIKLEENIKSEEKSKIADKKKIENFKLEEKEEKKRDEKQRIIRFQSSNKDKKEITSKEDERKDIKCEKARTREDAKKEKIESPEKKGTRSNSKGEIDSKDREELFKDKKEKTIKDKKEGKNKDLKFKKDDKIIKDKKSIKEKIAEVKIIKEKKNLKDKKGFKDKQVSSKDIKDEKLVRGKKEELKNQIDTKSILKRKDIFLKDRKDEKLLRLRRDNKSPNLDFNKKLDEEKQKADFETKKDHGFKTKAKFLREKITQPNSDEDGNLAIEIADKSCFGQNIEKRGSGLKIKMEEIDEIPTKGKRKSIKVEVKEENESLCGSDDDLSHDSAKVYAKDLKHNEIEVGDRVKVKYGRGRLQKVYEAKVLKIDSEGSDRKYYVHYAGWNMRYDEWVRKSYIVSIISSAKKIKQKTSRKKMYVVSSPKKCDRGRPPGPLFKSARKNSTSSTNSSVSCSRAKRSDKNTFQKSLSTGIQPKKRGRKKLGHSTGLTDTSQDSDSYDDSFNANFINGVYIKQEIISDDEDKLDYEQKELKEFEGTLSLQEDNSTLRESLLNEVNKIKMATEEKSSIQIKNEILPTVNSKEEALIFQKEKINELHDSSQILMNKSPSDEINENDNIHVSSANTELKRAINVPEMLPLQNNDSINVNADESCSDTRNIKSIAILPSSETNMDKPCLIQPEPNNSNSSLTASSNMNEIFPKRPFPFVCPAFSRNTLNFTGIHALIQKNKNTSSTNIETPINIISKNHSNEFNISDNPCVSFNNITLSQTILPSCNQPQIKKILLTQESMLLPNHASHLPIAERSLPKNDDQKPSNKDELSVKLSVDTKINISEVENPLSCIVRSDENASFGSEDIHVDAANDFSIKEIEVACANKLNHLPISSDNENEVKGKIHASKDVMQKNELLLNRNKIETTLCTPTILEESSFKKINSCPIENNSRYSEAFDLKETIPHIIERLKTDVVADLNSIQSSTLNETNFEFLHESKEDMKILSRSNSFNSLRICEDASDTNDSNSDTKDASVNDKLDSFGDSSLPPVSQTKMSIETVINELKESENSIKQPIELPQDIVKNVDENFMPHASAVSTTSLARSSSLSSLQNSELTFINNSNTSLPVEKTECKPNPKIVGFIISKASEMDINLDKKNFSQTNDNFASKILVNHEKEVSLKQTDVPSSFNENNDTLFDDLLKIKNAPSIKQLSSIEKSDDKHTCTRVLSSKIDVEIYPFEEKIEIIDKESVINLKIEDQSLIKDDEKLTSQLLISGENIKREGSLDSSLIPVNKFILDPDVNVEDISLPTIYKREGKKKKSKISKLEKRLGSFEGDNESKDGKFKDGKTKSKKRARLEYDETDKLRDYDMKSKSKKLKKSKNKKRFSKHEDQYGEYVMKLNSKDDEVALLEKLKKKEKRKNEKKFLKSSLKNDEQQELKYEFIKKKKGKKNRDKFNSDKKEFSEKKLKKKKKSHSEEPQDTDSEKELILKSLDKKKKKDKKKYKVKDCSSSDDAADNKYYNQQTNLSDAMEKQEIKCEVPDMSFLLCEEKVPASPVGINCLLDDTSASSSIEESNGGKVKSESERIPPLATYSRDQIISTCKSNVETCAVLDNTPPTTPSSTESLLSSSPSHERESFSLNFAENNQFVRESAGGEIDAFNSAQNRTASRETEEYSAATTLAFAVCNSLSDKPKEASQSFKRQKSHSEDHIPAKRKKKNKRMRRSSENGKSPRHKSFINRLSKVESYCEDSSGASVVTPNSPLYGNASALHISRPSPTRHSEIPSKYHFYVHLQEKDPAKRIAVLQDKMAQLRKEYMALKAEVAMIDRRRKKARKKIRDAALSAAANPSLQSEDGQSCS